MAARVVQQVEQHLCNAVTIGHYGRGLWIDLIAQGDSCLFAFWSDNLQRLIDQRLHI